MADDPTTIPTSSLPRPISPLRQRMLEDMAIRRMSLGTQRAYLSAVSKFSQHFRCSPDKLTYEDVRAWQLHLVQSGLDAGAVNSQITALRFFFRVTLGQRDARTASYPILERSRRSKPVCVNPGRESRAMPVWPFRQVRVAAAE